jgi:signal transduction histidine kinase
MRLRRWASLPLRTKWLLVAALPVLPLAAFWIIFIVAQLRQEPQENTTFRQLQVQAGLTRLLTSLFDADAAVRDMLFTNNAGARLRYRNAVSRTEPTVSELNHLVLDPEVHASIDHMRVLIEEEFGLLASLAGEPGANPLPESERRSLDRSAALIERIRRLTAAIEQRQMAVVETRNREQQQQEQEIQYLLGIGSIGCSAAGFFAALIFARGISRRHAVLADNVGRLARGETPRLLPPGDLEIAWIDAQFRDAANHLKQKEADLRQAVQRLEIANSELESFSYSVSHDLRAPLRAISGFSQALEEDCGDKLDEAGRDSLRRIRSAATRMGLLIDDMLVLSRITRMDLQREPVDVSGVAASVVSELSQRSPNRLVDVQIAPGVKANADPRMLRIALENLIENAFKYTTKAPRPHIEIGSARHGGPPIYYVRDNGAGFDMQYADRLFGAFQRLHNEKEFSGTGIGLATVQRIVHRHGGRIWADAVVNSGASFYFTLEPAEGTR